MALMFKTFESNKHKYVFDAQNRRNGDGQSLYNLVW